jgi:uncharacterized protein (DUF433 family)
MPPTLSATEVVALTGLEERRIRKDVEYGFFGSSTPPRFELAAVVYFRAVAELGFDLGVEDRKKLYLLIRDALRAKAPPARLALSAITELKLGEIVSEVKRKFERFEAWKGTLVEDDNTLGGEPVFAKSRLAVRQIGGMLIKGASPEDVREDYPYLKAEDIDFARLYTLAYPRVGRPRETPAR